MATQKTFSIVKPDAIKKNILGKILTRFEDNGLKVIAGKIHLLSKHEAQKFYEIHKERPFYNQLVDYMTSGKVFVSVLEGENAVLLNRTLMGATDPKKAEKGTIRADFADSIEENAVHGSDSEENALIEIKLFFPEILG